MKVLIAGLGSIAYKHITALRLLDPHVSIAALRSTPGSREEEGIENIYAWPSSEGRPDFVIISNPTRFHKDAVLEALKLQCPLFIEKPVLASVSEAREILALHQGKLPKTYIACNLRFHPALKYLKQIIKGKEDRLNEVNVYCGSDLRSWRPGTDYRNSYSAKVEMGGGVHLDLIHEIDYCYWLFGMPAEVSSLKRKVSALEIDSMDFAAYHLSYPSFTANVILNYYRKVPRRSIELVYDDDIISVNLIEASVSINGKEVERFADFSMADTYRDQMQYFIEGISGRGQLMNNFHEATEVLKIVET